MVILSIAISVYRIYDMFVHMLRVRSAGIKFNSYEFTKF